MCCICMLVMMDSVAYCFKRWTVIRCYNGDCMHILNQRWVAIPASKGSLSTSVHDTDTCSALRPGSSGSARLQSRIAFENQQPINQ